ncbi:putative RPGR, partial [Toxoplasma gondii CAST]
MEEFGEAAGRATRLKFASRLPQLSSKEAFPDFLWSVEEACSPVSPSYPAPLSFLASSSSPSCCPLLASDASRETVLRPVSSTRLPTPLSTPLHDSDSSCLSSSRLSSASRLSSSHLAASSASRLSSSHLAASSASRLSSSHLAASSASRLSSSHLAASSAARPLLSPQNSAELSVENQLASCSRSSGALLSQASRRQSSRTHLGFSAAPCSSSAALSRVCASSSSCSSSSSSRCSSTSFAARDIVCRCPPTQQGLRKHAKRLHSLYERRKQKLRSLEIKTLHLLARADRRRAWMTAVQTLQQIRSLRVARSDAVRAALEEKTRREAELLSCERRLEDKRTVVSQVQKQKASLLQERRRLRCKLRTDSAAQVLQLAQDDLREEERRIEAEESTLEGLRRRLYGAQQDLRLHAEMKHYAEIEDREKHARDTETERSGPGAAASANPTSALRQEMSEKRRELRTCEAEILRKKERLSRLSMEIEEILERSSLRARPSPSSASSLSVLSSSSSFLADDSKTLFSSAPSSPLADTAEKKRVLRDALDRRCVPGEKTRDKLSTSRSQSRGEHRRSSRRTEAQKTPSSFLGRRLAEEDELFALEAEVTACNQDLPVLEELLQERLAQATLLAGGEERLRPYASVTARNVSRARSAASLAEAVDKQETEAQVTNRKTAESRRETQERKREAEEGRRKVEEKGDEDGDISALFEPRKGDLAYVQLNAAIPGCTYTPGVSPEAEKQRERRAGRSAWFRVSTSLPSSPTAADSEELRGRKDTFRKEDCATHEALSAVRMPQGGNLESATCPLSPLETAQKASHPRGSALRSIVSASVLETSTPASESAAGIHCSFPSSSAASSFVLRSRLSSRGSDSTQEERFSCALSESQLPSRPDSRDASLAAASSLSPPVALPSSSSVAWQQTVAPAGREDECSLSNISSLSMVTPQTKGDVRARLDCAKEAASEPQAGSATPDRSPVSPTKVTEAERSRRGRTKAAWATVSEGNGLCFCADLGNASLLWEDMRAPEQRGTRAEAAEETPWNALLAWASSQTVRASRDSLREKGTPGVNPTACFQDSNFPLPLGRPSPGSSASSVVSHSPASRISPSGCAAAVSCASLGLEAVGRPGAEGGRPARETRETSEETETDLEEDQQRQRQVAGTAFEMSDANLVKNLAKLLALLEALPDVEPRTPEKATEREGRSQVLKSGQTQRGLALERRRRVTLAVERKLRETSPGDPAEKKETCRQESREASSRPSTALRPHLPFCYSSSSSFPFSSKLRCAEQGDTGNRKVAEGIYARRGSASAAFCETNEAGRENGGDENQRRNEKRGRRPLPKATQRDKHEEQKTRNKEARYTKQEQAGRAKEEEGPTSDAPEGRASEEEGPTSDAPEGRASEEEGPTREAPEGRASEEEGPTSDAPEGRASEEEGPTREAPEGRASEEEGPTSDAPEGRASEEEGPTS